MEKIRTLIVDDELMARKHICNLLQGRAEFDLIGECANGKEAVTAIQTRAPHLIFLDVQMPDLDGFGVLQAITPERWPIIIFTTAYDQYALRAFEVHALDYLLKPFDDERFEKALEWAKKQLQREQADRLSGQILALVEQYRGARQSHSIEEAESASQSEYLSRLIIKSAGRVFFIRTEEVDWIEAAGCYVCFHIGSKSHLLRETMSTLEAQLDPARFMRIHRSTIINLERVKEMQAQSHGECIVILQDGTQLKLSRGYREKLQTLLGRSF